MYFIFTNSLKRLNLSNLHLSIQNSANAFTISILIWFCEWSAWKISHKDWWLTLNWHIRMNQVTGSNALDQIRKLIIDIVARMRTWSQEVLSRIPSNHIWTICSTYISQSVSQENFQFLNCSDWTSRSETYKRFMLQFTDLKTHKDLIW
jgi:hypothetical protein